MQPTLLPAPAPDGRGREQPALSPRGARRLDGVGNSQGVGAPLFVHADPGPTLRVYAHLMPDSRKRARLAIDKVFERDSEEDHGPQTAQ